MPQAKPLIAKVLYGNSSDCDMLQIMRLSCTTRHTADNTDIAAVHLGRKLIDSPGGWPVDIDLRPATDDKLILKYLGYKVYGPEAGREYVEAHMSDDVNMNWSGAKQLFSGDPGTYVIQD